MGVIRTSILLTRRITCMIKDGKVKGLSKVQTVSLTKVFLFLRFKKPSLHSVPLKLGDSSFLLDPVQSTDRHQGFPPLNINQPLAYTELHTGAVFLSHAPPGR